MIILAADIGGTNTRIGIFSGKRKIFYRIYESRNFKNLESLVKKFLKESNRKVSAAVFGIPGVIYSDKAKVTNLPWTVSKKKLTKVLGIKKIKLLNDFEAICYGIKMLSSKDIVKLNKAKPVNRSTKSVIGPGTGLGEALMVWCGKEHIAIATEGGHAEFSARNELEWKFKSFMQRKYGYVSYELILSGQGLIRLYNFLYYTKYAKESKEIKKEFEGRDKSAVIAKYGLSGKDRLCKKALEMFVSFYGREAGNLALKTNSLGGIYLAGGITPKILPKLKTRLFLKNFEGRGKLTHLMKKIPVFAIKNEEAGLIGAANVARLLL